MRDTNDRFKGTKGELKNNNMDNNGWSLNRVTPQDRDAYAYAILPSQGLSLSLLFLNSLRPKLHQMTEGQEECWAKNLCLFYTMNLASYHRKDPRSLFYVLWGKYEKQYRLVIEQMVYFFSEKNNLFYQEVREAMVSPTGKVGSQFEKLFGVPLTQKAAQRIGNDYYFQQEAFSPVGLANSPFALTALLQIYVSHMEIHLDFMTNRDFLSYDRKISLQEEAQIHRDFLRQLSSPEHVKTPSCEYAEERVGVSFKKMHSDFNDGVRVCFSA